VKIVVLDGYTENPGDLSWEGFSQLGSVTVYDRTNADQIVQRIGDAQAVITNKVPITAEILAACPSITYIGVLATGYNVIDTEAAAQRGIVVTNIPSYGTQAVAQYTFALLLELCHHIGHHNRSVQEGRWAQSIDFCYWDYPLIELAGKTMGIIGFGRIGRAVAALAQAFGMKVLAYSPSRDPRDEHDMCSYADFDEVLASSDVLSLHTPLTEKTSKMINQSTISRMKDHVMIINTSRGQVIDEHDLRDALITGKVAGAAVDVVSSEPISGDNPLLGLDNCIITPHIAWASKASRQRLMNIAVDNLRAFIAGKPVHVVNL
jgi:glycerate dehydrogenase